MIHLLASEYGDIDHFDGDTYLYNCILTNKVQQLLPIYKTPCTYNIILSLFNDSIRVQIEDMDGHLINTIPLYLADITLVNLRNK